MTDIIIWICILLLVFANYMLIRNHFVCNFRLDMLKRGIPTYMGLPSYDSMLWRFWVWPLTKFLS